MGRPRTTPERAAEKLTKRGRERLLASGIRYQAARAEMAKADAELRKNVAAAVDRGASYRDIGLMLGMPHQTLHQFVKPYPRRKAEEEEKAA
jgi:hypothetical protein